jgi:hypothetical protein
VKKPEERKRREITIARTKNRKVIGEKGGKKIKIPKA